MTIRAEPMTVNKITVDENGITFYGWKITHDQPLTRWNPEMGFAVLDYLRERLETEAGRDVLDGTSQRNLRS